MRRKTNKAITPKQIETPKQPTIHHSITLTSGLADEGWAVEVCVVSAGRKMIARYTGKNQTELFAKIRLTEFGEIFGL